MEGMDQTQMSWERTYQGYGSSSQSGESILDRDESIRIQGTSAWDSTYQRYGDDSQSGKSSMTYREGNDSSSQGASTLDSAYQEYGNISAQGDDGRDNQDKNLEEVDMELD